MTLSPGGRPADASPVGTPGGQQNWVDQVGGLPSYIRMVAHALIRKGQSKSHAIATAVNMMRKWAAGADGVRPQVQAAAAKALAEWEAKKGAAHSLSTPSGYVDAAELLDLAVPAPVMEWALEAYDHDLPLDLARDYVRDPAGKFASDGRRDSAIVNHDVRRGATIAPAGRHVDRDKVHTGPRKASDYTVRNADDVRSLVRRWHTVPLVARPALKRRLLAIASRTDARLRTLVEGLGDGDGTKEKGEGAGGASKRGNARDWLAANGYHLSAEQLDRFDSEVLDLATPDAEVLDLAPGDYQPPYDWKHGYIPITPAAALSKAGKGPHAGKGRTRTPKGAKLNPSTPIVNRKPAGTKAVREASMDDLLKHAKELPPGKNRDAVDAELRRRNVSPATVRQAAGRKSLPESHPVGKVVEVGPTNVDGIVTGHTRDGKVKVRLDKGGAVTAFDPDQVKPTTGRTQRADAAKTNALRVDPWTPKKSEGREEGGDVRGMSVTELVSLRNRMDNYIKGRAGGTASDEDVARWTKRRNDAIAALNRKAQLDGGPSATPTESRTDPVAVAIDDPRVSRQARDQLKRLRDPDGGEWTAADKAQTLRFAAYGLPEGDPLRKRLTDMADAVQARGRGSDAEVTAAQNAANASRRTPGAARRPGDPLRTEKAVQRERRSKAPSDMSDDELFIALTEQGRISSKTATPDDYRRMNALSNERHRRAETGEGRFGKLKGKTRHVDELPAGGQQRRNRADAGATDEGKARRLSADRVLLDGVQYERVVGPNGGYTWRGRGNADVKDMDTRRKLDAAAPLSGSAVAAARIENNRKTEAEGGPSATPPSRSQRASRVTDAPQGPRGDRNQPVGVGRSRGEKPGTLAEREAARQEKVRAGTLSAATAKKQRDADMTEMNGRYMESRREREANPPAPAKTPAKDPFDLPGINVLSDGVVTGDDGRLNDLVKRGLVRRDESAKPRPYRITDKGREAYRAPAADSDRARQARQVEDARARRDGRSAGASPSGQTTRSVSNDGNTLAWMQRITPGQREAMAASKAASDESRTAKFKSEHPVGTEVTVSGKAATVVGHSAAGFKVKFTESGRETFVNDVRRAQSAPGGITESTARRMSDDQLERAMQRLMADGTYSGPAYAILEAELNRRDKARAEGNGRRR